MLICQRHQTTLRLLSNDATTSTRWRVRELYCTITYVFVMSPTYLRIYWSTDCGGITKIVHQLSSLRVTWNGVAMLPWISLWPNPGLWRDSNKGLRWGGWGVWPLKGLGWMGLCLWMVAFLQGRQRFYLRIWYGCRLGGCRWCTLRIQGVSRL